PLASNPMCGRFASTSKVDEIIEALGVEEVRTEPLPPRYNVAPTAQIYAVATSRRPIPDDGVEDDEDGSADEGEESVSDAGRLHRVLGTFRWGLVPSWAKDISVGYKMINARSEGIAERPAYRRALLKRRCIIPVDYYYEWQARPASQMAVLLGAGGEGAGGEGAGGYGAGRGDRADSGEADSGKADSGKADSGKADSGKGSAGKGRAKKPKAPPKLPWAIHRADGRPMLMAGLWEVWHDPANPEAEPVRSCTIVTTAANAALAAIHDRMPAILDSAAADAWLDPDLVDKEAIQEILRPAPPEWFAAHPISTRVNRVGTDGSDLLDPIPDPPAGVDLGVHLPR
ncbi:MAG: SOS response-associated peptidase, partial [Acidimicrobiaceae bacterium]|nr:SOS response-associated peptidase [Acidimicrobiaceae bacterium]